METQAKSGADGAGQKLGDAFGELFKGMLGGSMSNSKDAIQIYIKDPEKRIVGLEFQDAQGKPLKTRGGWTSNDFKQTDLDRTRRTRSKYTSKTRRKESSGWNFRTPKANRSRPAADGLQMISSKPI